VPFPNLGEIDTPSFSPDGKKVVFSALSGGFSDLFIYDLDTKALRHVTEDAFADLQPTWSPDGGQIAFVTDRFSTDLATLHAGNYRLAVLDVGSGTITEVPTFEKGKNINPQWTKDCKGLYFLSDHTGITNVYRLDVASRDLFQLTDLISGVSGITALSPALSVAVDTGRIAYSVYDEDRYEIYSIDDLEKLAGWRVLFEAPRTASVIPGGKDEGKLVEAQKDALKGLADANTFTHKPYKAKFGLDYIGQPYLSGGSGSYGAFFGGGIAMGFSDMLGNHSLNTVFQVDHEAGYTNVGGIVSYLNKSRRINWGASWTASLCHGDSAPHHHRQRAADLHRQTTIFQQTDTGLTVRPLSDRHRAAGRVRSGCGTSLPDPRPDRGLAERAADHRRPAVAERTRHQPLAEHGGADQGQLGLRGHQPDHGPGFPLDVALRRARSATPASPPTCAST
jgi:hypothetical protein